MAWVDYAKGIGIVLMVVGHVWRGLQCAGYTIPQDTYVFVDLLFYSFHMPMFFFLSGMFAARSVYRPTGEFLSNKARTILYPYILWSLIQGGVNIAISAHTNRPMTTAALAYAILLDPYSVFWFLYCLFFCMILILALTKLGAGKLSIGAVAVTLYLSRLAYLRTPWPPFDRLRTFFLYFTLGVLSSDLAPRWVGKMPSRILGLAGFFTMPAYLVCVYYHFYNSVVLAPVAAALGTTAVFVMAILMDRAGVMHMWNELGIISLEIYAAHVLGTAGARIVLEKALHTRDLVLHMIIGTTVGVLFPVALVWVSRKLAFTYLFRPPVFYKNWIIAR